VTASRLFLLAALAGGALASAPASGQAQRPGHEIDQKAVCLSCHELPDLEAKVKHAPAATGECSACHSPHVARFKKLLRERPGPLCARCHEDVQKDLARQDVHPPVAEGKCAACHRPHGSANAGLLVAPSQELCATCHTEVAEWKARKVQHGPFAQGRCAVCHDPHASDTRGLLTKAGAAVCTSCHAADATLRARHQGFPVERAACQQCHDPHASSRAGLFRESLHPPFESGDCRSCHRGPGAAQPFETVKAPNALCAECHADQVEKARKAPFPHVPSGGGECVSCHNPHTGEGKALLRRPVQALCTSCHDPGGAKSGGKDRHTTHGGFDCTRCHAAHGGERPLLLVEDSVVLCGSCHKHEHGVSHPLGEKTRDPRTGIPMTCRSCHGLHRSEGQHYLFEDEKTLCLGCHKNLRGRQP
jgi:predicted CXXCH cytochrome family protein